MCAVTRSWPGWITTIWSLVVLEFVDRIERVATERGDQHRRGVAVAHDKVASGRVAHPVGQHLEFVRVVERGEPGRRSPVPAQPPSLRPRHTAPPWAGVPPPPSRPRARPPTDIEPPSILPPPGPRPSANESEPASGSMPGVLSSIGPCAPSSACLRGLPSSVRLPLPPPHPTPFQRYAPIYDPWVTKQPTMTILRRLWTRYYSRILDYSRMLTPVCTNFERDNQ